MPDKNGDGSVRVGKTAVSDDSGPCAIIGHRAGRPATTLRVQDGAGVWDSCDRTGQRQARKVQLQLGRGLDLRGWGALDTDPA